MPSPKPSAFKCSVCDEDVVLMYVSEVNDVLTLKKQCFYCNFWLNIIHAKKHNPQMYKVYKGVCYRDFKDESYTDGFQGFGGRTFSIKMKDGTELTTDNLWCQGRIPARFRDQLPDNVERMCNPVVVDEVL